MISFSGRGVRPHGPRPPRLGRLAAAATVTVLLGGGAVGCATSSANGPAGGPASAVPSAPSSASAPASQQPSAGAASSASTTKPSATTGAGKAPGRGTSSGPAAHPTAAKTTQTRGSIRQTVKPRTVETAKPVSIGPAKTSGAQQSGAKKSKAASPFGDGVTAKLTGIRHGYVRAKIPGQISGASVIFDLTIKNGSGAALDLNPLVVNLTDASGSPTQPITSVAPAKSMPDLLQPGRSATGTFVFVVPKNQRNPVTVDVTVSADLKVVTFRGDVR